MGHHQGKFIGVPSQVALEIHSPTESRLVCGRRLHRLLLVICPPRGAQSRDSPYHQHLAVPSTSLQTVPGALPYPPRSPLRGFGRARKRGYLSDLHDVRGREVGRKRMSPTLRQRPVIAEEFPPTEYSA